MISNSFSFDHFKKDIWKIYFSLSLFMGLTFFFVSYYLFQNTISELFFIIAFTVISFSFRKRVNHEFWPLVELEAVSICLYAQFICLIAHFYHSQSVGMLFLATVPMLAALINFNMHQYDRKDTDRFESVIYLASFFVVGAIVANLSKVYETGFSELLPFIVYATWVIVGSYFLWSSYITGQKSFMIHLLRNANRGNQDEVDKMFFHDIINQTHGLRLFLESYQIQGQDLEFEKLGLLISEIQVLQNSLQDHFGKGHKDLEAKNLEVGISFAHLLLENLVKTYLPENRVKVTYIKDAKLTETVNWKAGQIELHPFHRMMTNLIKNAAEYRAHRLEIFCTIEDKFLVYRIINPLNVKELKYQNIDKFLTSSILTGDEGRRGKGIGLNSVSEIAAKINGEFQFYVQDGHWVSMIKIPFKLSNTVVSSIPDSDDKAA